jgi:hypothetical protein
MPWVFNFASQLLVFTRRCYKPFVPNPSRLLRKPKLEQAHQSFSGEIDHE